MRNTDLPHPCCCRAGRNIISVIILTVTDKTVLENQISKTVGKGNVIKMKQKKTVDAGKIAKPSIRKVGTILGSSAMCVLAIGTISVCGLISKNADESLVQEDTKAAVTTTTTTEAERFNTYTTLDTVAWRKASINEYEFAEVQKTSATTSAKTAETTKKTEKVTEKKLNNVVMYTTEIVKLRKSASSSAEAVATLALDDKVRATAELSSGWYAVTYDNYSGYIKKEYLTKEIPESVKKAEKAKETSKTEKQTTAATTSKTTAATTSAPAKTTSKTATTTAPSGQTVNCTDEEFDMLCYVLQGEVGGCSEASKIAVANVILNRVKSSRFPNTIAGVLTANNQFTAISGYYNNTTPPTQNTIDCARRALNGEDNTNGAIFYYAPRYCGGSTAAWFESLQFCMELDGQRFFKY